MVKKSQHGFSLLELVIAIAIIGVLAAIAIPSYNSYLIKSRRSDAKVSLVTLAQLQESWYVEHGNQYAALANLLPSTNLQGFNQTGTNYFSKEGHYQLEVTLSNSNKSFLLKATPVDPQKKGEEGMGKQCYIFTLNEQGQKGVLESTATDCWS